MYCQSGSIVSYHQLPSTYHTAPDSAGATLKLNVMKQGMGDKQTFGQLAARSLRWQLGSLPGVRYLTM